MDKLHAIDHPIHELLRKRWSPRAFAGAAVTREQIDQLLEAARWSPSSSNEQPWRFIVATQDQPEAFAKVLACLVEGNQRWAKNAPLLMLGLAAMNSSRSGKPNAWAKYDLGQAVAQLTFQATALGLYVHQMAGFVPETARSNFNLPPDIEPTVAIAIGHLGDPAALPDDLRERELAAGTRRKIDEFVHRA